MEHDFYGRQKQMWRMDRGQRAEIRELTEIDKISMEVWDEYFTQLYQKDESD